MAPGDTTVRRTPGKPVEASDDEHGATTAAFIEGGEELGAIGDLAAALDLGELGEERRGRADMAGNRGALSVKAQAGSALAVGGDAVICDVGGHRPHCTKRKGPFAIV